jgi:hypothetical protein
MLVGNESVEAMTMLVGDEIVEAMTMLVGAKMMLVSVESVEATMMLVPVESVGAGTMIVGVRTMPMGAGGTVAGMRLEVEEEATVVAGLVAAKGVTGGETTGTEEEGGRWEAARV